MFTMVLYSYPTYFQILQGISLMNCWKDLAFLKSIKIPVMMEEHLENYLRYPKT